MYKTEAATNAGATPEKARKRGAEVHQAGLHLVLEAIRELCAPHRTDSPTARSIPERFALPSSWETSLLITSMSAGEAMDAECVQLRMIGWQTPTRFGLSSTGGRAIVLYSAMLSLALTTMGTSYIARGR